MLGGDPTLGKAQAPGGRATCRKSLIQGPFHKLTNKRGITSDALISLVNVKIWKHQTLFLQPLRQMETRLLA